MRETGHLFTVREMRSRSIFSLLKWILIIGSVLGVLLYAVLMLHYDWQRMKDRDLEKFTLLEEIISVNSAEINHLVQSIDDIKDSHEKTLNEYKSRLADTSEVIARYEKLEKERSLLAPPVVSKQELEPSGPDLLQPRVVKVVDEDIPYIVNWGNKARTIEVLARDGIDYNALVSAGVMGGEDPACKDKRDMIKKMMRHAWNGYVTYAWGANELKPVTRKEETGFIFGKGRVGATLVDAMDTLFIMEEYQEVMRCREWLAKHFKQEFMKVGRVSVFETTIRFIGGFNTMYSFTKDPLYMELSRFIADLLIPAFSEDLAINVGWIMIGQNYSIPARTRSSLLAEVGTLQIEWGYLSYITGNMTYHMKTKGVFEELFTRRSTYSGLFPITVYRAAPNEAELQHLDHGEVTLGGAGDSYYEYLLKYYLFTGSEDELVLSNWRVTLSSILHQMVKHSLGGLYYVANLVKGRESNRMQHLACFVGGLFGLSSEVLEWKREEALRAAESVTETCHMTYNSTATNIGPEGFAIASNSIQALDRRSLMRPETIESYFVMWRLTHNQKYRDWGWEAAQAMEKHYRTGAGYSGIRDVNSRTPVKDDVMQSFFLAETLKYLYLLFSDDSLIPLDKFVLNTEAHPVPVLPKGSLPKLVIKERDKLPPPALLDSRDTAAAVAAARADPVNHYDKVVQAAIAGRVDPNAAAYNAPVYYKPYEEGKREVEADILHPVAGLYKDVETLVEAGAIYKVDNHQDEVEMPPPRLK